MKSDFLLAITQLAAERNLPKEVVLSAVEAALLSAYRKDDANAPHEVSVKVDPFSGEVKVYTQKVVVESVEEPNSEIALSDAQKLNKKAQLGQVLAIETTSVHGGRIAAQTAKQVVLQRLREAEREFIFGEYADREGEILSGVVQRIEPRQMIIIDLGKAEAILPPAEQVRTERYRVGQRLKVYLLEVNETNRGPRLVVSRSHPNLLRRLFELEVPEIYNGTIEVKAIAREPGSRSKVAVFSRQEGVDAVGSCVGLRGVRIQNVVNEINGERADVIQWHSQMKVFIANALSPAHVVSADVNEEEKAAEVVVPDGQLSLAIGKEGQNARLAARLTGYRIDIKAASVAKAERAAREAEAVAAAAQAQAVAEVVVEGVVGGKLAAPDEEAPVVSPAEEVTAAEEVVPVVEGVGEVVEEMVGEVSLVEEVVEEEEILELPGGVGAATGRPQLRFAEDIFVPGAGPAAGKKKAKKEKKAEDERQVRARRARKERPAVEEFEELLE